MKKNIQFHEFSKSTNARVKVLVILYVGLTLFFDFFFGADFLKEFLLKPRDILILLMFCWFFFDRRSDLWNYISFISFKNWEMWPIGFLFGWICFLLAKVWFSIFPILDGSSLPTHAQEYGGRSMFFLFDAFNAALVEELVFKPFLLILTYRRIGRWGFVLLSGFLWSLIGLAHAGFSMMIFMLIYGVSTAFLFFVSRNLGFLVFSHLALFLFV